MTWGLTFAPLAQKWQGGAGLLDIKCYFLFFQCAFLHKSWSVSLPSLPCTCQRYRRVKCHHVWVHNILQRRTQPQSISPPYSTWLRCVFLWLAVARRTCLWRWILWTRTKTCTVLNAILHHTIDFVCNFTVPHNLPLVCTHLNDFILTLEICLWLWKSLEMSFGVRPVLKKRSAGLNSFCTVKKEKLQDTKC